MKPAKRKPKRPKPPPRPRLKGPIHGRITELRERRALSQRDLADALGVHYTAVNHWERGMARPSVTRLAAVAKALGVTVDALIAGEKAS